jgi:signal transduction histidine kinase/CheY-like chemotaxis protein
LDEAQASELRATLLDAFFRRTPINSAGTLANTLLFVVLLYGTAPTGLLSTWALFQAGAAIWFYARWRRQPGRKARGTKRGQRLVEVSSTLLGMAWGASVFLLHDADQLQRFVVFLAIAAMAAGAAASLVPLPKAARGYVLGALLPTACYFAAQGDRSYWVLGALALSFIFFLLRATNHGYESFLAELRLRQQNEQLIAGFRGELSEWLELSQTTHAFALIDDRERLLLFNQAFEQLFGARPVLRGSSYRQLLDSAPLPLNVNGQPLTREDWIRRRLDLVPELTAERSDALNSGELLEEHDGQRWYQVAGVRTSSGRVALSITDVSLLKQAELAIRARDRALESAQRIETVGTLAGAVAHDFNNMLTAIRGFAELLEPEVTTPTARDSIDQIKDCVARGSSLTRQLLAYGRRQVLRPEPLALNALIEHLRALVEKVLPSGVKLELDLAPELGVISADATQLEHVLLNLVINAGQAMPEGGTLTLGTRNRSQAEIELWVQDTGVGMDEHTREHAFEPFFTTRGESDGSGLGLAVTHGIIQQSGGNISLESRLGEGTLFRIGLPRVNATPSLRPRPTTSRPPPAQSLLVVDDDDAVRWVVAQTLKQLGYGVVQASNAEDALEFWKSRAPEVAGVVTDVRMPGMDGVSMVEAMKQLGPEPRVLFMTGYDSGALQSAQGLVSIQKPFDRHQLAVALSKVFAG